LSSLFSLSSSPVVRSIVVHSAVCRRRGSPPVPSPVFRLLIPPFQNVYQYAERLSPSRKGTPWAHSAITERLPLCGTTSPLRNGTGTALERHYLPRLPCTNVPKYRNPHSHLGKCWRIFLFRYLSPHRWVTCSLRDVTYDRLLCYVGLCGHWLSKNYDFSGAGSVHTVAQASERASKRVVGNLRFPNDNAWYGHWCQVGGHVSLPLTLLSWTLFDFFAT
jgi:hypothetical protein